MRAGDYAAAMARAQAGVVAAWEGLAAALHKDLEVFAASYAVDQAMVDAVCEECWPTARGWLDEQRQPKPTQAQAGLWMGGAPVEPIGMLVQRLRDQALGVLRLRLADCGQQSITTQDALLHLIVQSGLEALPRTAAEAPDVQQAVHDKLGLIPPAASGLLNRRYREGLALAQLVEVQGRPRAEVAAALALARAAIDWHVGGTPAIDPGDRDLPILIEEFLDGTLAFDVRLHFVQSLLDDLERTAYFVRQVRLDLVVSVFSREMPDGVALLETAPRGPSSRVSARRPAPPAAGRAPVARKPATSDASPLRWLALGAVVLVIAVVGGAIALLKPAPVRPSPGPTMNSIADHGSTTTKPANGSDAPPTTGDVARVESGQPTVQRAGNRMRLQPGAALRGDDSVDTAQGQVVFALGAGRTLTIGVNSLVNRVRADGAMDVVVLERGQTRIEAPAGARGVLVRVGQTSITGDGAAFTISTMGAGLRLEVGRGTARIQRGTTTLATVVAEQMAIVADDGELALATAGTFVAGIDLGGPGAVVDGHRWKSQRHALADGLTIDGGALGTLSGLGGLDTALKPLLETGLGGAARLTLALPDGSYDVVGLVAGKPGGAAGTLTVNGQTADGDTAGVGANGWRRLWPRRCTVTGGRLQLAFTGSDQQLLAGLALHACGPATGRLPPTVFFDEPADDLSLVAPTSRVLKANAYAASDAIRVVEFLVDGAKVGEAATPPYVFQWSCQTPGVHPISVRAITGNGLTASSATVTITVKPPEKPKPALLLTLPEEGTANTSTPIALGATPDHVDAAIVKVAFFANGTRIGEAGAAPWRYAWAKATVGEHVLTAVATLADGGTLTSAPRTLTVQAPARPPPTAAIDSPGDGEEVADSGRLTIRVKASAPEGRVARVEFTADGQKIGEASAPPFTFTWLKPPPGWHQLGAMAIDAAGTKGNAEPVLIAVGKNAGLALVRGIDLGGDATDGDGGRWLSHDEALAAGLALGPGKTSVEAVTLTPEADLSTTQMLATAYESAQSDLKLTQELSDGLYQVALWITESKTSFSHACDLEVQGVKQLQPVGRLAKGAWAKYGPFPAKVKNQRLTIVLHAKGIAPPKLMGLAIYAPLVSGNLPRPLIDMQFDTIQDNATPNTGLLANAVPVGIITPGGPQPSRNLPPGGGTGSVDFAKDPKPIAIDLPGAGTALKNLKSFTISAWVNSRDNAEGRGGNRIMVWSNVGGDGVDLVCHQDGSLGLGINAWNDITGAEHSSAGKITANDLAPADNWRFLAVTYDSTLANQQVRYYFGDPATNALLDRAVDYSRGPVGANPSPDLTIGHLATRFRTTDNTAAMFRGLIDQVRIWGSIADGSGALTAEQIVAVQTGGNVAARGPLLARAGTVPAANAGGPLLVDDFERAAPEWEYVGGWEFPGAKGLTVRDQGTARSGTGAYRVDWDFTGGGVYVGTWKKFEGAKALDATELRFWVKTAGLPGLGIRLADGSGQLHQSSVRLAPTSEWQEVVVKIATAVGGEHWGGANDGKWQPPLKGLGLNVGKDPAALTGTLWIDDLSVVVPAAK